MLYSFILSFLTLLLSACGAAAEFVDMLPDCWQECINNSDETQCSSARCLCKASNSGSFLSDMVSCARSGCEADDWAIDTFLIPLQAYCAAIGREIPESIVSSAQCAATESSQYVQPTPTSKPKSPDSYGHKTKSQGGDGITSAFTTTITQTTTDDSGATLQVIVPVMVGPNTMSTGKATTSTIGEGSSSTDAPKSTAASPSPTAAPVAPQSTPVQQGHAGSSTTSSKKAKETSSSNGSPFDNMQASASRWTLSGPLIAMGLLAGAFMRL